jgi:hypothetical protein
MHRIITGIALVSALVAASFATASAQMYGRGNLPQGSYQQSCTNLSMRGSTLSGYCTNANGQRVSSSLNVSNCNGSGMDIGNVNGYLTCNNNGGSRYNNGNNRYNNGNNNGNNNYNNGNNGNNRYNNGYGNRVPGGSYQQTCNNARVSGGQLTANCMNNSGSRRSTSIMLSQCRSGADIGNVNGRLRCVYNQ